MSPPRILVAEDERVLALDLALRLGDWGYDVVGTVATGEEAVQRALETLPHLVLLDVKLQGSMNGIQAARQILARVNPAIVYLSEPSERDLFDEAKLTLPYGYLTKPVSPINLKRAIEMALDKHRIENQLRESEERLQLAVEAARIGLWDWHIETDEIFWSDQAYEIAGLAPDEVVPTYEYWLGRVHPDDAESVLRILQAHLNGLIPCYEAEYRFRTKSGDWKWIQSRGKVTRRDASGKPVRITGTNLDVTARRAAQAELEESHNLFRSVLASLNEAVMLIDPIDRVITDCSRATEEMFGYSAEELIGSTTEQLHVDGEMFQRFRNESNRSLDERGCYATEYRMKRKNGAVFDTENYLAPIRDETGRMVRVVSVARDISHRKWSERLLTAQRDLSIALAAASDLDEALNRCIDAAVELSGLECVSILLVDERGGLELRTHRGLSERHASEIRYFDPQSPHALLVQQGKPDYEVRLHAEGETLERYQRERIQSVAVVPILHQHRPIACLCVGSREFRTNPDQVRAALEAISAQVGNSIALIRTREELRRSNVLLQSLHEIQGDYINGSHPRHVFAGLVEKLVTLTNSEYGFIDEVRTDADGSPYRELRAIVTSSPFCAETVDRNVHFEGHESLVDAMVTSRLPVISNDPPHDPRWKGTPEGHPLLRSFLSIPLITSNRLVGLVGLANRPVGYHTGLVEFLQPYAVTCATIIEARRTERRRREAEEALKQSEERFRALFENSPIGMFESAVAGRFLNVNDAFARMFGYASPQEVIESVTDIARQIYVDPDHRTRTIEEAERNGRVLNQESLFRRKDGTVFVGKFHLQVVREADGSVRHMEGFLEDVTERKRTETAAIQTERLKALADLSTGISHNFNNWLQIILGNTQLAQMDLEFGDLTGLKRFLKHIEDVSRLAAETVRRLQSFSRQRAPGEAGISVFDLAGTVARAIELTQVWWKTLPEQRGIAIRMVPTLTPSCRIRGNEGEIFEVVVNLIRNAAEAMPDGGELGIRAFIDGNDVVLQVSDTGGGIPREFYGKVFEPFFSTKGPDRAGMGLASSYGILRGHSATISVASTVGRGAIFTVRLPLAGGEEQVGPTAPAEPVMRFPFRVLVVDDMPAVLAAVCQTLASIGATVLPAHSGLEALAIFDASAVDLVLCDLGMPGMNGWEVGKRIRTACEERGRVKPPFVILTGWGDQAKDPEEMAASGVDAVIGKPIDVERLAATLRNLMKEPMDASA